MKKTCTLLLLFAVCTNNLRAGGEGAAVVLEGAIAGVAVLGIFSAGAAGYGARQGYLHLKHRYFTSTSGRIQSDMSEASKKINNVNQEVKSADSFTPQEKEFLQNIIDEELSKLQEARDLLAKK